MPPNTIPIFTLTPNIGQATISTANANLDGTGTIGTIFTAGANGTRVSRITIKARVTTTAGMIRIFIYTGAAYHLWREVLVTAITKSASVASFEGALEFLGDRALVLPTGYSIRVSTEKAEAFDIVIEGGDY